MKDYEYSSKDQGTTERFTLFHAEKSCTLSLNDHVLHLMKNDVVLAREKITYAFSPDGAMHILALASSFIDGLFDSQTADCRIIHDFIHAEINGQAEYLFFNCEKKESIALTFSLLDQEMHCHDEHHEKMVHLMIVGLVTLLDRIRPRHLVVTESTMVSENRFGKIMKYIGDHYSSCTLQEVAEKFGYNPDYLSTLFRKITGQNFTEKLLEMKLDQAELLLRTTDLTSSDIAMQCGFESRSWFIRKFTERYGLTPAKWRKAKQTDTLQ